MRLNDAVYESEICAHAQTLSDAGVHVSSLPSWSLDSPDERAGSGMPVFDNWHSASVGSASEPIALPGEHRKAQKRQHHEQGWE